MARNRDRSSHGANTSQFQLLLIGSSNTEQHDITKYRGGGRGSSQGQVSSGGGSTTSQRSSVSSPSHGAPASPPVQSSSTSRASSSTAAQLLLPSVQTSSASTATGESSSSPTFTTTDPASVLLLSVPEDGTYTLEIHDANGQTQTMQVDSNNTLLLLHTSTRPEGQYPFTVRDADGMIVYEGTIHIVPENGTHPLMLDTQVVVEHDGKAETTIGTLTRGIDTVLTGRATPFAQVVGYFSSTIRVSITTASSTGAFMLSIPEDLEPGRHTLILAEVRPDGTWSRHQSLSFVFQEPLPKTFHAAADADDDTSWLLYLLLFLFLLLMIIASGILMEQQREASMHTKHRKRNKAHRKRTSRIHVHR